MKKFTFLLAFIAMALFTNAQNRVAIKNNVVMPKVTTTNNQTQPKNLIDTLTAHCNMNVNCTATIYSDLGGGFLGGHDSYADVAKAQKFDATYGVSNGGIVTNLLFWFGAKIQASGTATVVPTIWADAAGVPGSVLGTATPITVASIDTSGGALQLIGASAAPEAAFNVTANFTGVTIPANHIFWAGFTLVYAAGDSVGLVSSTDGEFTAAVTHTFEQWSDNSWNSFNDGTANSWQTDVAMAIYPVVDFTVGINEVEANSIQMFPNPASNNFSISSISNIQSIKMMNVLGEVVYSNVDLGKNVTVNTSDFAQGVYVVQFISNDKTITKKLQIVK